MSFKPFYIHGQRLPLKSDSAKQRSLPRGFTAYISPSPNPRNVFIQHSFCAYRDRFSKAQGRDQAVQTRILEINKRHVAGKLAEFETYLYADVRVGGHEYAYVFKYLL